MRHSGRLTVLAAFAAALPAGAQNPIASKVVGSRVAAQNRENASLFRAGTDAANARASSGQDQSGKPSALDSAVRVMATLNKNAIALKENASRPASASSPTAGAAASTASAATAKTSIQLLDSLRAIETLKSLVDDAARVARSRSNSQASDEQIASRALALVLRAQRTGHTNPERWYVGGQVGATLFGDGDVGDVMHASARAAYFIPMSPFRRWQLPVVTNLGDLSAKQDEAEKEKAAKIVSSSQGAYVSLEPTWDPVRPSVLGDLRLQPFLAVGAQVNRLKAKDDDSTTVALGQTRVGAGANLELGRRESGQSMLFLTSRALYTSFSATKYEQVFGERRKSRLVVESYALVPVGASTSLLVEATASQRAAPVIRVGLWAQASASK